MNETERMKIVVGLDDCVSHMRAVISVMRDISGEDLHENTIGDGFYNACEAKLKQIRDMSRLGYERLRIECEHRNQVEGNYTWSEWVEINGKNKLLSSTDARSTYNDKVLAEYRRCERDI